MTELDGLNERDRAYFTHCMWCAQPATRWFMWPSGWAVAACDTHATERCGSWEEVTLNEAIRMQALAEVCET